MNFSDLRGLEVKSNKFLEFIDAEYKSREFGFSCIEKNSINYLRLREAIRITAGGGWRKHIITNPAMEFDVQKSQCKPLPNNDIFLALKDFGWSSFDLNHEMLEKILYKIDLSRTSKRHSVIDHAAQKQLLKIVPVNVYRAIKQYLGTSKIWICPPHVLHSKSFTHAPTVREMSDLAFLFHRDIDSTATVKIFINLTDAESGSHEYYQRSNYTEDRQILPDFLTRQVDFFSEFTAKTKYETHVHDGRFSSQSLQDVFGVNDLVAMPTKKGYAWVEDTYGLHRGTPCFDGERKVLVISILKYAARID